MSFLDAYKHLEKLCGEVMQDSRKVTAYIEAMVGCPDGAKLVKGWENDLKALKHYRSIRNELAHNPDASERKLVKHADIKWVKKFYKRLKKGSDPLSLYKNRARVRRGFARFMLLLIVLAVAAAAAVYFLYLR
jgi:hypothetical protein